MEQTNLIAWHNKRYTPEQIKLIQSALNRLSLGRLIEATGKMDQNTLNAIIEFQTQHSKDKFPLKVDGLAGDKTLAALGISDASYGNLNQTRAGVYQGKNTQSTPTIKGKDNSSMAIKAADTNLVSVGGDELQVQLLNAANVIKTLGYIPQQYSGMMGALSTYIPDIYDYKIDMSDEGTAIGDASQIGAIKRARNQAYYNSPEMIHYLTNPSNARGTESELYYNLVNQALPYLSATRKGEVRSVANLGDEYDEDIMNLHVQAVARQRGIANMKKATEYGQLTSGDQIDRYAQNHSLSRAEMQEGMEDPALLTAREAAAVRQDNGRVLRNERINGGANAATLALDASGRIILGEVLNPMRAVYTASTFKGGSDKDLFNYLAYNQNELSDVLKDKGYYNQTPGLGASIRDFATDLVGNPWAWASTGELLYRGGKNVITAGKNIMKNAKNGVYGAVEPVGVQGIAEKTIVNPVTNTRYTINQGAPVRPVTRTPKVGELYTDPYTGKLVRSSNGQFANAGATGIDASSMSVNGNGLLIDDSMRNLVAQQMINNRIPGGFTQGSYHGGATKVGNTFLLTPYESVGISPSVVEGTAYVAPFVKLRGNRTSNQLPILEVPTYDNGVTYGPHVGVNRYLFKDGGIISYANYLK